MFAAAEGQWRASLAVCDGPGGRLRPSAANASHRYRLDLITVPEITQVRFRIHPSAYHPTLV